MQRNHKYGRPTISYMQNNPYSRSKVNCLTFKELSCRRRQWHPTPVLLPGKSHRQRSPVGCSPWGLEESDTTERLPFHFSLSCIGEGNGNPLQCSCLENPRDGGAWWAAVYGVAQSRTWLKRLSSSSSMSWREKATAPHSGTLAWKIPWMAEPGRLQSMGSLRVGHSWVTSLSLFTFMHWRRKWWPSVLAWRIRDGGAWLSSIYGVAQSWTWLKQLSSSSSSMSWSAMFQKVQYM